MTLQEIKDAQADYLDAQIAAIGNETELTEAQLQNIAESGIIIYYTVSPNLPDIPRPNNG